MALPKPVNATVNYGGIFDLPVLESDLDQLRQKSLKPDFWSDQSAAAGILKKIARLEKEINRWNELDQRLGDLDVLMEFAEAGETKESEVEKELSEFVSQIDYLELQMMLGEKQDVQDAIVTIHPGAGGTESQDWAEMLYRMYKRWAEKKEYSQSLLDYQPGDEAGIKDVTFEVKGGYAYGLLKAEAGIHRLVRISPFDAANRRHTSFASVFVYPSVDEEIEVDIDLNDLRIDTYRASGAGGQHVNRTDSAVRITHEPSGIVVTCQNERSQHKNKSQAMKVLKARLYQLELEKEREAVKELESQKKDIAWGSQIRSYVFHPYTMVKDHRTKEESGNGQAVMDGDLDRFIRAYLMSQVSNRKSEPVKS